jgi:hypothetical protein
MPQSMHGPGSHVAPADQTMDPDSGVGADADALIRGLGVAAGDRLDGRYRLDTVLHTTGPAVTWLATDEKLNRASRIHLLRSDQPRAEAFMAAARAAAAMPDNHFVQVLDAVPDEGLYYVITEWLHDGHTLGDVLARGPVPVAEAVRIATELARAMAEAHDNGLAHLRLSPKTVLRTDTGEVKILDLCLAAALTGTVSRDPLGTDLTAIGELAYAMLTGKRPQPNPAPPSELRSEVTPQLDEVVLRILGDPSVGEPYQTPTEVAEALSQLPRPRYENPLPSTPQTAPLRHAQTTVMSANTRPTSTQPQVSAQQGYPPAPMRPEPRPVAPSHGPSHGGSHGGGRRPAAYDDEDYGRGSGSPLDNKNVKIGGGIAAVLVVALIGYLMFSGDGKPKGTADGTHTSAPASTTQGSDTTAPAGAGIVAVAASVYDSDDGTEGKGGEATLLGATGKWQTRSYCQASATVSGKAKPGTGVIFDLGAAKQISTASVTLLAPGASMEMWAADAAVTSAPSIKSGAAPDGFTKVASAAAGGTTVDLKADKPVTTRFVLVWFTNPLPALPTTDTQIKCAKDDGHRYGDAMTAVKFNGS